MPLRPDINKQAIEVGFPNNRDKKNYLSLMFSCSNVQLVDSQKYLGLILNSEINFNEHIKNEISKCEKITSSIS